MDADPKATQQIAAAGQLKNEDGIGADGAESIFYFNNFRKIKEKRIKLSTGSVTVS